MNISKLFKRNLKPGQLTRKEKRQTIEMNPGLTSVYSAKYMYYHVKNLPESVLERKRQFKKQTEIENKTQKLRDISSYRKNKITKKKTTDSGEYGKNISILRPNEDVGTFLEAQNIKTNKSSSGRGIKNKKTRKHRKNRKR